MRYTKILTAVALLGLTTACADNDPIEGERGSASAEITDDASSSASLASDAGTANQSTGTFSGTFTSDAEVAIAAESGAWVDLGSPTRATVTLQSTGDRTSIHANSAVPAGIYTRVRLTLSGGRAHVTAGGTLGDNFSLTSDATINVGGSDNHVVIEKQVQPFTVGADTHVRILFDLNSEAWINQQSAEEENVEDEEVERNTTATPEEEVE